MTKANYACGCAFTYEPEKGLKPPTSCPMHGKDGSGSDLVYFACGCFAERNAVETLANVVPCQKHQPRLTPRTFEDQRVALATRLFEAGSDEMMTEGQVRSLANRAVKAANMLFDAHQEAQAPKTGKGR